MPASDPGPPSLADALEDALCAAHAALHRQLEEGVYDALAALVRQDVSLAAARWKAVVTLLDEHQAFEEQRVLPAYEALAPSEGPGRVDHVRGDHIILQRHVDAVAAVFAHGLGQGEAGSPPTLRAVLEALPAFYRFLATLEHHTAREQTSVYPALARSRPRVEVAELTEIIQTAARSRVVEGRRED